MNKPSGILKIPTSIDSFFEKWLLFLKPFHGMTERQIGLAAQYLKIRYELSKNITDEALLDEIVMSDSTKKKVREACNVSPAFCQGLISELKKRRFFEDGRINPMFIPKIVPSQTSFLLLLYFDVQDNK